jgi:hypothetical protein
VCEATLACRFLFGQDVALECMFPLDLTRSGESETLLRTGIGLHLRHNAMLILPRETFHGAAKVVISVKLQWISPSKIGNLQD